MEIIINRVDINAKEEGEDIRGLVEEESFWKRKQKGE
jgi:hypothetical protein